MTRVYRREPSIVKDRCGATAVAARTIAALAVPGQPCVTQPFGRPLPTDGLCHGERVPTALASRGFPIAIPKARRRLPGDAGA
jgi:hypothetical protein